VAIAHDVNWVPRSGDYESELADIFGFSFLVELELWSLQLHLPRIPVDLKGAHPHTLTAPTAECPRECTYCTDMPDLDQFSQNVTYHQEIHEKSPEYIVFAIRSDTKGAVNPFSLVQNKGVV
jgi:hypothetical protein